MAATRSRRPSLRRRILALLVVAGAAFVGYVALSGLFERAVRELTLPLRHDDIIRQQAREKGVDASLIAAVIYAESRFSDQTSSAGARGLMQITRDTADYVERRSGGTTFEFEDLADPDINIRYGTFYLREQLDSFEGNEAAALAAYNAGPGQAARWGGSALEIEDIGFEETRDYVEEVLDKREEYRDEYTEELGY
jgi:soluble lytic murein transglycosylase